MDADDKPGDGLVAEKIATPLRNAARNDKPLLQMEYESCIMGAETSISHESGAICLSVTEHPNIHG